MSNKYFQQTGKNVPIGLDELISHMFNVLKQYDSGENRDHNPYTESIVYTTKSGKMIQIPKNVQQIAINQWTNKKSKNVVHDVPKTKKSNKTIYYVLTVIALIIMFYVGTR